MNNGLFGFFIGANVTIDVQEFDITSTTSNWVKPQNAKLCFVEATGGGASGAGSAGTAGTRAGGQAGVAYPIILLPEYLNDTEEVIIGAGGVGTAANAHTAGGDTTFAGFTWSGGLLGSGTGRVPFSGGTPTSNWGTGGAASGTPSSTLQGRHGGFGAGGGGRSAADGGKPRSFQFLAAAATPERGGGAPSGSAARPEYDIDGFGEGAGGGTGSNPGNDGRRGSGGGGCGNTAVSTAGGKGGDGFLRVITYCW